MTWLLVGTFALTAASSVMSGQKSAAGALNQTAGEFQNEAIRWADNAADNKAIQEANLTNQIRNGYRVGLLNVQRGQAKKQALESGSALGRARVQALSGATANAAAAGSIGSSVDAVISDIDNSVQEAGAQQVEDYRIVQENFDTQLRDLLTGAEDQIQSTKKLNTRRTQAASTSGGIGEALVGAAIQTGGSYLSANMSLGLGKPAGK